MITTKKGSAELIYGNSKLNEVFNKVQRVKNLDK